MGVEGEDGAAEGARIFAAVARPMLPKPMMPQVSSESRRSRALAGSQRPARTSRSKWTMPRAQARAKPTAWSDTSATQ